jgi:hypothetical protein
MPTYPSIQTLRGTLVAMHDKQTTTAILCQTWRDQSSLLEDLPSRYLQVMEDLLARLESGSHFTEESCSYSQEDLLANLADWLNKAELTLNAKQHGPAA